MDALNENYKEGLQQFIKLQSILLEQIQTDIDRSNEDISFEKTKMKLNVERMNIEVKSLKIAEQNLKDLDLEEK